MDPNTARNDDGGDGEMRDEEGLLIDEYSDPSLEDAGGIDALDIPSALVSDAVLIDEPVQHDGIVSLDRAAYDGVGSSPKTSSPEEQRADSDQSADEPEPRSVDELAQSSIGTALRGRKGVTRDDELHGERMLDSPDES